MHETSVLGYYTSQVQATQDSLGRPSGGIGCLIKPSLVPAHVIQRTLNLIVLNTKQLVIIGTYFQPDRSAQVEISGEDR
ncbi:hypothetical protein ANN_19214 [Periplaneta americana]|uniref:Uncharacterized protein n=1 Tax=Periplaneta americana TaxID=6978 RepID=A0ABQ8S9W4_PERAM|nr:hypothetical protein ANN_19214 [Periplaneta americana]